MDKDTSTLPPAQAAPQKKTSVIKNAGVISACILLSRILGFIRDVLISGFFGKALDAFVFAFQIPNLFRKLFGEGALSAAFIPTLSHYLNEKPYAETIRFINIMITLLFGFLSLIAGLVILTTFALPALFPSFMAAQGFSELFLKLLRIMIPYLPLVCVVALLQAVLNSLKHFMMPALASVVLNICWIGGFLVADKIGTSDENKVAIMAWSILVGGVMEIAIQIPILLKKKITFKPIIDFKHPGLKEVLTLMLPTVFGLAVFQVNLFMDSIIAKAFIKDAGALSALYLGNRLMQFPFALIGISLATALFPYLAELAAKKDYSGMMSELSKALRIVLFVGIPASLGLMILAELIVHWSFFTLPTALFPKRVVDINAIARTTNVLIFYSLGIWSYGAVQIINRAFYSLKDMKTPVKIGIYTVIANVVLNIALVFPFKESGIALATTISSIMNLAILLYVLNRKANRLTSAAAPPMSLLGSLAKQSILPLICSLLMCAICLAGLRYIPKYDSLIGDTIKTLSLVTVGALSYLGFSYLIQHKSIKEIIFGRHSGKTSTNPK